MEEIVRYISRDSRIYAMSFAEEIIRTIESLSDSPRMGRMVPEYGDDSIREVIVSPYRIVYHLTESQIGIIAVAHGRRNLPRILGERKWDSH